MPKKQYDFILDVKSYLIRNKASKQFNPNQPLLIPYTDKNGVTSSVEGEFVIQRIDNNAQLVLRYKRTGKNLSKRSNL